MPQMAPISWLILFFIFSMAFMLFNILNYYCFFNKNKNTMNNNDISTINVDNKNIWKW